MPKVTPSLGQHAVVIGGSIGGLLAARVLSDYFERVTIVERDVLPDEAEPRKHVPQGRHVHALFGGGVRVIERLLPGFFEELVVDGAVRTDFVRELCWYHQGVWKLRTYSDLVSYWQTRPFLEAHLRRRVRSLEGVVVRDQCEALRLLADPANARIVGVEVQDRQDPGRSERLPADLVVHAGGRGGRLAEWLEAALGYARPEEQRVEVNIGYASRFYERPPNDTRDWQVLATFATPPDHTRSGYLFPVEGGRWLATLVGSGADYPPADERAFLAFAQSLEVPDFFAAVKDARPLSPVATFQFPAHCWRRYDRLVRLPEGLVALGDAVCSFNPVYGQGMSVCALEVDVLDRLLATCGSQGRLPAGFDRQFARAAANVIATPWLLATTSDFTFAKTRGRQSFATRLLKRYVVHVFKLCASNEAVLLRFYRVLHFLAGPATLFHPDVVFQVAKSMLGLGRRPAAAQVRPAPPPTS